MTTAISLLTSMATREVLIDLLRQFEHGSGIAVHMEATGGVDAFKRVQAGEVFDVIVLSATAIEQLIQAQHVLTDSRVDLVRSGVSVAVRRGAAQPDISSAQAVRAAVLAARSVGYSTGPSGIALMELFERWGIREQLTGRLVQAPPGTPVGELVRRGEAELGLQQLTELIHLDGITVIGPLPAEIQIYTIFSAGLSVGVAARRENARRLLDFLSSAATVETKRRHGAEHV